MIIAFLRLAVIGFVIMTIFYFLISIYSRSLRKEKLEDEWVEKGSIGDQDDYVEKGLKDYDASIRPKLILGVYIVPTVVVAILFYIMNYG